MLHLFAILLFAFHCARATPHSSIPEDLYAFPKYRVSFLNNLPVANETAELWIRNGLQGGEAEFLGQWDPVSHRSAVKEIGSGHQFSSPASHHEQGQSQPPDHPSPVIEHIRLGPTKSYVCLIPPPPRLPPPPQDDSTTVTPSHSWSLLQPLSGTCLYHRQGWFTYSYCHNLHVRQFRELPVQYPHPPGARVVEEDPEWESYTLGKSSAARNEAANDDVALSNNLELAHQGAGQRYLVQRWSDGTICDKTGRPREIEVQFHCSMTMTDTVMFVKETRTCEYVLVVHTPRLCGEPGFKSRLEQMPEAALRCREVVSRVEDADSTLPEGRYPLPRQRGAHTSVPGAPRAEAGTPQTPRETFDRALDRAQDTAKLLRRVVESLLGSRGAGDGEEVQVFELQAGDEEGEFIVNVDLEGLQRAEDDQRGAGASAEETGASAAASRGISKTLLEALRAAESRVQAQKGGGAGGQKDGDESAEAKAEPKKKQQQQPQHTATPPPAPREEL